MWVPTSVQGRLFVLSQGTDRAGVDPCSPGPVGLEGRPGGSTRVDAACSNHSRVAVGSPQRRPPPELIARPGEQARAHGAGVCRPWVGFVPFECGVLSGGHPRRSGRRIGQALRQDAEESARDLVCVATFRLAGLGVPDSVPGLFCTTCLGSSLFFFPIYTLSVDRRRDCSSRNGMRHYWILERITVGILAAHTPPEHLNRRHVDRDDEELSQVSGRRFQWPDAVPGMRRPLEKKASISPGVQRRGNSKIIECRG